MLTSDPETWDGMEFYKENVAFIDGLPPKEGVNKRPVHTSVTVGDKGVAVTIEREALVAIQGSDAESSSAIFMRHADRLEDLCLALVARGIANGKDEHVLTAADVGPAI